MSVPAAEPAPAVGRSLSRRVWIFIAVYAVASPFVFFLFFLIRGGWLAISVALMAFPSSLIWLAANSVPQGIVLGLLAGLMPRGWPWWAIGAALLLLGAAMAMANSLWLGLALIDPAADPVNLAAVGLIGGVASFALAAGTGYVLRGKDAA